MWLVMIVESPSIAYKSGSGMAIADVGFNYVTLGDANIQSDLYNAGVVSEVS